MNMKGDVKAKFNSVTTDLGINRGMSEVASGKRYGDVRDKS